MDDRKLCKPQISRCQLVKVGIDSPYVTLRKPRSQNQRHRFHDVCPMFSDSEMNMQFPINVQWYPTMTMHVQMARGCWEMVILQKKTMTSRFESMSPRESRDPRTVRPYGLCDGGEDSRPRRSDVHSRGLHKRRLFAMLATDHQRAQVCLTFLASVAVHVCLQ